MRFVIALVIGAVVALSPPRLLTASQSLAMMVSPSHAFAPATLRVQMRVEPHADNRALELVADSMDFYRSSVVPLDGQSAPRFFAMQFVDVPSGEYEIRGILMDGDGRARTIVRHTVMVIGSASGQ